MPPETIPVRRVLAASSPTGGCVVTRDLPLAMLRNGHRGSGLAGTRGYHGVPQRVGTVMPMCDTVAAPVMARLGGFPYSGDEFQGMDSAVAGYGMRPGSTRLGALGADVIKWAHSTSADADAWWAQYGAKYGAEFVKNPSAHVGKRGKDRDFVAWAGYFQTKYLSPVNDDEANLIKTATQALDTFIAQMKAGQLNPDTSEPAGSMSVPSPTNTANQALYDTYLSKKNSVASARLQGRMMWDLLHPVSNTPTTTTPTPTTPTSTPTSTPAATGTTQVPVVGVGPSATGAGIYGDENAAAGAGNVVLTSGDRPGTSVVPIGASSNGQNQTSSGAGAPLSRPTTVKRNAAVGVGVAALIVAALLYARKRRRARPASAGTP